MRVPVWVTLVVAAAVIGFGSYRIWLSFRPAQEATEPRRAGFYRQGARTHLLIGIAYLLLGGALVATSFGWNPFGNLFGPGTEVPKHDQAPTKGGVPIDQLPTKK